MATLLRQRQIDLRRAEHFSFQVRQFHLRNACVTFHQGEAAACKDFINRVCKTVARPPQSMPLFLTYLMPEAASSFYTYLDTIWIPGRKPYVGECDFD